MEILYQEKIGNATITIKQGENWVVFLRDTKHGIDRQMTFDNYEDAIIFYDNTVSSAMRFYGVSVATLGKPNFEKTVGV